MKFQTENSSIEYLCKQLEEIGYSDIDATQSADKYCFYDVSCTHPQGYKYEIEVKRRDCNSTFYGDTVIEYSKFKKFKDAIITGDIKCGWLVTFFNDCWTVSSLKKPIVMTEKTASHTTEFEDNKKIIKSFVHFGFDLKFDYK